MHSFRLLACISLVGFSQHVALAAPRSEAVPIQPQVATRTQAVPATLSPPLPPVPDASGTTRSRFISFAVAHAGLTALKVTFVALHHVDPPYPAGPSLPFTLFEGQFQYVGPPTRYVESLATGVAFYSAPLQCEPYYRDWSTMGLLQVTGEAIVPSSIYEVQTLAATCEGDEDLCDAVSPWVTIQTSRWGDVVESPSDAGQPVDFADISALVNKFKSAPEAPNKSVAMLVGLGDRGLVDPRPDVSFGHVAAGVDAFRGQPYPFKPGRCTNNSSVGCIAHQDCAGVGEGPGVCLLCGLVDGGACCHADGTCDILPESVCNAPTDVFHGDGSPCSRCCGPSPGCKELTNFEWIDAQQLWPGLDRRDICREELEVPTYNCIAWVLGSTTEWIWDEVDLDEDGLWESSDVEEFLAQYQKSAVIYGSNQNAVLHTARPLPNNCASSKLGAWIRVRHDRNQIEGGYYGDLLDTHAY